MNKKKKLLWLSYDLGLKGDYTSLYTWLDSMNAKECGNSIASFWFEYESDYLEEVKKSLEESIDINKNYRFYLIWRFIKDDKASVKGEFLFGKRKPLMILQMKRVNRPERVLIDTGFWIALYNPRDEYYDNAHELLEIIQGTNIVLPWPTLYETINTRLSKNTDGINQFGKILKQPNTVLLEDAEYRERALEYSLQNSANSKRPISLVDSIIREILSDVNVDIHYLITYNKKDFIDLCLKRRIEILG